MYLIRRIEIENAT